MQRRCRYSGPGAGVKGRCRGLHAENQMQRSRCGGGKLERRRGNGEDVKLSKGAAEVQVQRPRSAGAKVHRCTRCCSEVQRCR